MYLARTQRVNGSSFYAHPADCCKCGGDWQINAMDQLLQVLADILR